MFQYLLTPDKRECSVNQRMSCSNSLAQSVCPGWRGAVKILSTMPTVDWVLLGSGKSIKGWDYGSRYCSFSADAPCFLQEKRLIIIIIITIIISPTALDFEHPT